MAKRSGGRRKARAQRVQRDLLFLSSVVGDVQKGEVVVHIGPQPISSMRYAPAGTRVPLA